MFYQKRGGGGFGKAAYFTNFLKCNISWPYIKRHLRRPHSRVRHVFISGCGNLKVRCGRDLQWHCTKFGENRRNGSNVWRGRHTQTQHGDLITPATCHSERKFGYEMFTSKPYDFFFTSFFLSFLDSLLLPTHSTCRGLLLHLITLNAARTQTHTTLGRTPLDKWSAHRRDPYLTTQHSQATDTYTSGGVRARNTQQVSGQRPMPEIARPPELARKISTPLIIKRRSHWSVGLGRGSEAARFLGLRVWIPPGSGLSLVNVLCYEVPQQWGSIGPLWLSSRERRT
jgi:hypothetical protein